MLQLAYPNKESLQTVWLDEVQKTSSQYASYSSYLTFSIKISEDTWDSAQFVSMNENNEIIGYISYAISRVSAVATEVQIMSFGKNLIDRMTFLQDCVQSMINTMNIGILKLEFSVNTSNVKAMSMYDKLLAIIDNPSIANIIGTATRSVQCREHIGKLYDKKMYEINFDVPGADDALQSVLSEITATVQRVLSRQNCSNTQ